MLLFDAAARAGSGKHYARLVGMVAVEQGDVANALYQMRGAFLTYLLDEGVPRRAVAGADAHFEQFMAGEGEIEFFADCGREALSADYHHRFEFMPKAAQVVFLFFRQR